MRFCVHSYQPPCFPRLKERSAESANRVKEQSRGDGCCWWDSLGHYLSSSCKCCMALSLQVTAPQGACTFKDAYDFLHAYLLLTRYMLLLLKFISAMPHFTVQVDSLCSVKRNVASSILSDNSWSQKYTNPLVSLT